MTIRPATPADEDRVVEMATRFLTSTPFGVIFPPDESRLRHVFHVTQQIGVVLVAEVDVQLVAMLAILAFDDPFSGQRNADEVAWWVEPEYRRGTIGPRLFRSGLDWARQNGCAVLKMVEPHGSTAGRFYERVGFRPFQTVYYLAL